MRIRRWVLGLIAIACMLGSNPIPVVPVVFLSDVGPDRLYWKQVVVRPSTFFCLAYPKHSRKHPITLKCLSVELPGNTVRWDLYNFQKWDKA